MQRGDRGMTTPVAIKEIERCLSQRDEELVATFGYCRLEEFDQARKRPFCEASHHYYDVLPAIAVVALVALVGPGLPVPCVFPVCSKCLSEMIADLVADGEKATLNTCYIGRGKPLTEEELSDPCLTPLKEFA
jgi:hypothetical protein